MLTKLEVEKALPANLKTAATQQLVDTVNQISSDPMMADEIRNNFVTYTTVLRDGKFKMEDYLNAVVYVTHKLMGRNTTDAYALTFPNRYQSLVSRGAQPKEISAYAGAYNQNKLVNLIYEQTLIPVHILNQSIYQKAINVQADLMMSAQSEKVRSDAANSILTNLAKPKEVAPAINLNVNQDSGMNELKNLLTDLAQKQLQAMNESGMSAKEIAEQKLIPEAEIIENGT